VAALDRLKKLADADERTLSYLIDKAIKEFVDRADKRSK
jgi:predicted transcriptional regulator